MRVLLSARRSSEQQQHCCTKYRDCLSTSMGGHCHLLHKQRVVRGQSVTWLILPVEYACFKD